VEEAEGLFRGLLARGRLAGSCAHALPLARSRTNFLSYGHAMIFLPEGRSSCRGDPGGIGPDTVLLFRSFPTWTWGNEV